MCVCVTVYTRMLVVRTRSGLFGGTTTQAHRVLYLSWIVRTEIGLTRQSRSSIVSSTIEK